MSDCPFLTFLDVARDISSRVATAESLGASGVIFVSSNPGMPVPFVPGKKKHTMMMLCATKIAFVYLKIQS